MADKTLLEIAEAAHQERRGVGKKSYTLEHLDLAIAYAEERITMQQVAVALGLTPNGKSKANFLRARYIVSGILLWGVREGLLIRTP